MKNLRKSWLTGEVKEWDAKEAVAAARHVLSSFDENRVKDVAKSIDNFLQQGRKLLESDSGEVILTKIEAGILDLGTALRSASAAKGGDTGHAESSKAVRTYVSKHFRPLINRFNTNSQDSFNMWHLALAINGGLPPALREIAPNETYAILTLYAAFSDDVLSAYKFAIVERAGIQMDKAELEPLADTARRTIQGLKEGNKASAKARQKKSYENQKKWRALASEEWPKHPGYTLVEMAEWIRENHAPDAALGTIIQAIKGLKSGLFKSRADENRYK